MLIRLAFLSLLCLGTGLRAAEKNGIKFPDATVLEGKKLVLNGLGVREATIFKVDVYVAGLYLEKKNSSYSEILASPELKKIEMRFVRSVGKEDMTKAWKSGFERNCGTMCESHLPALEKLNSLMTEIKEGDRMSFVFRPDSVEVSLGEQSLGQVKGEGIDGLLLKLWIGVPPNEGLKAGLLGSE